MKRAYARKKKHNDFINIRIILPDLSVTNVVTIFYASHVDYVTKVGMQIWW